jgi:hypothetical protein
MGIHVSAVIFVLCYFFYFCIACVLYSGDSSALFAQTNSNWEAYWFVSDPSLAEDRVPSVLVSDGGKPGNGPSSVDQRMKHIPLPRHLLPRSLSQFNEEVSVHNHCSCVH